MQSKLYVKDLVAKFEFKVLFGQEYLTKEIKSKHATFPGLELTGYLDNHDFDSPIIFSDYEYGYLNNLNINKKIEAISYIIHKQTPYILLCENCVLDDVIKQFANEYKIPVLKSYSSSLSILNKIYSYTSSTLSKKEKVHGTLLSVDGTGVLLIGESGIGKSETALALIKRGHRLVADDCVLTYKKNYKLYGTSLEHTKNLIEVRGLGIIDVNRLYGLRAVLEESQIDYVINLVPFEKIKENDRILDTMEFVTINDTKIPQIYIPISSGRSIADIIEVSVMELYSKSLGYSASNNLMEKFDKLVKED